MVAAHDSKSCPARGESSSLSSGTNLFVFYCVLKLADATTAIFG